MANATPQSETIHHFGEWYPAEFTAARPNVYNTFYHPSSALFRTIYYIESVPYQRSLFLK